MPSLMSSPVSVSQPGCEARKLTLHKAMPNRRCFDHRPQDCFSTEALIICILACHRGKPLHATDIHQSHRMISNVRHTVHLQVRSGSERNRRHLVPRISINLQIRLEDHKLIPSSWVYSPIKIINNHPNNMKTSGLQPPSSSSTYRRISYSEWDKPSLSE